MKNSSPCWSEIPCGFRLLVFFAAILFLTSNAFGAGGKIRLNPSTLNFGSISVGTSQTRSVTLTNSGGYRLAVTQANLLGTGFTFSGLTYPVTLAVGQSVTGQVMFAPTSSGTASGMVSISFTTQYRKRSSLIASTITLPLSGAGTTSGQIAPSPTSLAFGSVQVGNSHTMTETLTNSGGASVTISAASATGSGFSASGLSLPMTLSVGQSVSFSVTFMPTSGSSASGNLAITSNASSSALNVPLSGTGSAPGQLTSSPTSLSFGNVTTGSSSTLAEKLTNSGGSSLTISQITPSAGFSFSGISLPVTLAAAQSVTFNASFTPQTTGSVTGSLLISSNGSNPSLTVPSSGTGTLPGQLAASPTSLSFGNVTTGSSSTLAEKLTNSGGTSLTISQITPSAGFSFSGITLPLTLAAAQSVTFNASFAPQTAGSVTGSLVISSNGSNPSLTVPSTGTGTLPGQLAASPTSLSFGNVTTGSSSSLTEKLTNSGGTSLTISQITPSAGFSFSGITLPLTLAAAQSVTFNASFTPQTTGSLTGSLVISSNGSNPSLTVPSSGTGTLPGQLAASPTTLSFGNVTSGTSSTLAEKLTNSGGTSLTISQITPSAGFSFSGITLPLTLAAAQSVSSTLPSRLRRQEA